MHVFSALLVSTFVLQPAPKLAPASLVARRATPYHRASPLRLAADDERDIDWDQEAAALVARSGAENNRYYQAIKGIAAPELVREFAKTAPKGIQIALKATVGQLLGNMPSGAGLESEVTTSGKNLGSLMFSMQMTGYMFRNAEYRRSLAASLEDKSALPEAGEKTELPPISGRITVTIAEGMEAQVDAAAYMSELRAEVEGLRAELVKTKQEEQESDPAGEIITFIQSLPQEDAQALADGVSSDVLSAMGQLVSSLLIDMDIPYDADASVTASTAKLRELLITQLVSGYKLRELEARDEIKDRFWS